MLRQTVALALAAALVVGYWPPSLGSKAAAGGGVERRAAAWLVLCAHGTPTMKKWSFDVRSGGSSQAAILSEERDAEVSSQVTTPPLITL